MRHVVLASLLLALAVAGSQSVLQGQACKHEPGYCAMYGICGRRKDGDVLNCANNTQAQAASDELARKLQATCPTLWAEQGGTAGRYCCTAQQIDKLAGDTGKVAPFTVGCPACLHNFVQLWCFLSCSSDQATFTNVTHVQLAADNNETAVKEIDVWTSKEFTDSLYNSCKDVKFGAANLPAMNFMGGGAKDGQEWLEFLGEVKDKRVPPVGSPFQQNFNPTGNSTPAGITPAVGKMASCGDPLFLCSCADCPVAPGCSIPTPGPPPETRTCRAGAISCWDLSLLLTYIALVAAQEPLLGMAAEPGAATVTNGAAGEHEGDETEPLPGDVHYPWLERKMQTAYTQLGQLCASRPLLVILAGALLIGFCLLGLIRFRLETNPQQLWVGPGSRAARDKAAYEASFGPFYRVAQLILSTTETSNGSHISTSGMPGIVTDDHIRLLFDMQDKVDAVSAAYTDPDGQPASAALPGVCFKPFGTACATQSLLQYWHMDRASYVAEQAKGKYATKLTPDYCFGHWATQCRSAFEAPMDPHVILGGFSTGPDFRNYSADATAFVVTYPIDSAPANLPAALAWEAAFLELAQGELSAMAAAANLSLAFQAERSVEDELKRESYTDASVVAVSYLVMLGYITFALAALPPPQQWLQLFVLSRAALGAGGVVIVAGSVAGAVGLCSLFGMWSTLIIMEVIPFLVLAVGVDNMFVLAHALGRQDPALPLVTRAGLALGSAGPSITLAASCEVLAFGLGALTPMPAVRNFSICAATAVLLDFILQVTVFMALLVLDSRRLQQSRLDCLPCVRVPYRDTYGHWVYDDAPCGCLTVVPVWHPALLLASLQAYMERVHAPLLMQPLVQVLVVALFVTGLFVAGALIPRLEVGLDQAVALPRDSYMQQYYRDLFSYLRVGPPLYLVVSGVNVSAAAPDVNKLCSVAGCRQDSLAVRVSEAAMSPASSFIASPAASWVDDFLSWTNPALPKCCRVSLFDQAQLGPAGSRCPPPDQPPCSANASACADCEPCFSELPPGGRPNATHFAEFLPWFLEAVPSEGCAKGGRARIAGLSSGLITASAFRTYHTPLNSQPDFINALKAARQFAEDVSQELGMQVYPYSIFHIFFEQYLNTRRDAVLLVGLPLLAVFGVAWLFTGSLWGSAILLAMLVSLMLQLAGSMYLSGIEVNAVSLVNLAMALGIAVEFCAHILHSFCVSHGSRRARARAALVKMGAPVTSGITLTKFAGVVVLAFARTQIFEVYYFRLYLALVILGAAHGLVLLPVAGSTTCRVPPKLGSTNMHLTQKLTVPLKQLLMVDCV
ncbi:multidrug efflux transporter AcrB transmembrane domain-containing protein [Scenedesmus sp. NREL 46B-D3]|nr:multidrug efflux transporter AcrB transmembrane domain-containing protein [Scenedesmus sp. NREL 46B-D3]